MENSELDSLVQTHQQAVLSTARRLLGSRLGCADDTKDVVQEVFLRLFVNRAGINGNVGAWLYRVTVNVCNDYYRRRRKMIELPTNTADPTPSPDLLLRLKEKKRIIAENLGVLTDRERATVFLRFVRGYSTTEVGELLRIKEATVRGHIFNARMKLVHLSGTGRRFQTREAPLSYGSDSY